MKFLMRDEPIAGLEINSDVLRLVLLSVEKKSIAKEKSGIKAHIQKAKDGIFSISQTLRRKTTEPAKIEIAATEIKTILKAETDLAPGVVQNGEIKNREAFVRALSELAKKIKPFARYVILSVPSDYIFSRIYSFPKNVGEEKLTEAMNLITAFQLPIDIRDSYLDWEKVDEAEGEKAKNNMMVALAMARKKQIDAYLSACAASGLNVVAIEYHPMSIARIVDGDASVVCAFAIFNRENTTMGIVSGGALKFSKMAPLDFVNANGISEEIRKMIDFYESETGETVSEIKILGKKNMQATIANRPVSECAAPSKFTPLGWNESDNRWLVALSAAYRGITPRESDAMVSLMPMGTEETYARQKAVLFADFIASLSVGLAIFFVIVFSAAWSMMFYLRQNFNHQFAALSSRPLPSGANEIEERAKIFNSLVKEGKDFVTGIPRWSEAMENIRSLVPAGVAITAFSFPSTDGIWTMTGFAKERTDLNGFKKNLEKAENIAEVNMPLANIGLKAEIPFSVTFRLKDPSSIYFK